MIVRLLMTFSARPPMIETHTEPPSPARAPEVVPVHLAEHLPERRHVDHARGGAGPQARQQQQRQVQRAVVVGGQRAAGPGAGRAGRVGRSR